jgi:2-oxoglutarate ferredoxin oxidoreductase subunit delta
MPAAGSAMKTLCYLIKIDSEHCKGCELCVAVCPKQVLAMSNSMNSRGQHGAEVVQPEECKGCLQCTDVCPEAAIQIDQEAE